MGWVCHIGDEGGMAAVSVGQISEFQSELESVTVYLERLSQFFIANGIPTVRQGQCFSA